MTDQKKEYLGDGVYASFDGEHIWLAANDPENDVIALNEQVIFSFIGYVNRLIQKRNEAFEQSYGEYQEP